MENNTRDVRCRMMIKEVLVFIQDFVGKKKLVVQFKYGQKNILVIARLCFYVRKRRLRWMIYYLIIPKKNKVNC